MAGRITSRVGLHIAGAALFWTALGNASVVAQPSRSYDVDARVTVRDDRTYRAEQTVRTRVLTEQGLAAAASVHVPYIETLETLDIVAIGIERADGPRTSIEPAKVETRSPGGHPDARTKSVAFPDVRVGDTLVYTTVRDVRQTSFEGQFHYAWTFARSEPWARATYVIDAPSTMALHADVADPSGALKYERVERDGRATHTFSFEAPPGDVREESGAVAPIDRDPSFTLTTLPDHLALAAAYWSGAAPQAVGTPTITALARDIMRGAETAGDKARAVDRWMKRNIRYQAQYLGRERWQPKSAASVLTAGGGDCKDHAVLMTALLDAVGIETEHVLVNLGASYGLPKLPPAAFNHVMVHIPAADITLDPSAALAAPGVLSLQAYDKPTLNVGKGGARLARTPPMKAEEHTTTARTQLDIAAIGTVTGRTTQTATGIFATSARAAVLRFAADGLGKAAEQRLAALGTPGSGTFETTSPSELREPYAVTATFALADQTELPLAGNRRMPVGIPVHARPGQFLLGPRLPGRKLPFVCFAGTQTEEITLVFADGLALPRVPQERKILSRVFTFEQRFALVGRRFTATRTFTSTVPGQVCPPQLEAELDEPLKQVIESLGTMLSFPGTAPRKK